jgi:glycosyltransferase involved in cell wall biosynthesis
MNCVRVLRVIARLNVGGPARHVAMLGDGLRARGFDTVLVYGSTEPTEGSLEDLVESRGLHAVKIPELGRRIRPWSDVHAFFKVLRLIFRERPDVVHTHTAKAGALGRLAAFTYNLTRPRDRRCLIVHTFHGHVFSGYFGPAGSWAVRTVERALAAMTDQVLTISAIQKDDICRRYRIAPARKTRVIELGIETEKLLRLGSDSSLRRELGIARDDVVFSYVGRFVPIKDLPTLVRAFATVAARTRGVRLLLVGDGELRGPLERLARELGLTDRVHFTGWRRDLGAVYGATDVGVLSSINEGTPVALIETMVAGRPVVSTDAGGVRDIVAHERTGLVVPSGDAGVLADAMERLVRDPELRARLGRAARTEIASRFALERLNAEIDGFYREALAQKRHRVARRA